MSIRLNVGRRSECLEVGERQRRSVPVVAAQCENIYETAVQPVQRSCIELGGDARQKQINILLLLPPNKKQQSSRTLTPSDDCII